MQRIIDHAIKIRARRASFGCQTVWSKERVYRLLERTGANSYLKYATLNTMSSMFGSLSFYIFICTFFTSLLLSLPSSSALLFLCTCLIWCVFSIVSIAFHVPSQFALGLSSLCYLEEILTLTSFRSSLGIPSCPSTPPASPEKSMLWSVLRLLSMSRNCFRLGRPGLLNNTMFDWPDFPHVPESP